MKKVSAIAYRPGSNDERYVPGPVEPVAIDAKTAKVIDELFDELKAICPGWRNAWPTTAVLENAKRSWTKAFQAAGINTIEQIRFGVQRCRQEKREFAPPSGLFIDWCTPTPEQMGLLPKEAAYMEACINACRAVGEHRWSHRVVYHAACDVGMYTLRSVPEKESRARFLDRYHDACRRFLLGQPLRSIPENEDDSDTKALCGPPKKPDKKFGNSTLANIKQTLRGGNGAVKS